jgi:hypothetical protein
MEVTAGMLRAVLRPYLLTTQGLYPYFLGRSQTQPKLRALIDFMRRSRISSQCARHPVDVMLTPGQAHDLSCA